MVTVRLVIYIGETHNLNVHQRGDYDSINDWWKSV
jgi:hypothetical protein